MLGPRRNRLLRGGGIWWLHVAEACSVRLWRSIYQGGSDHKKLSLSLQTHQDNASRSRQISTAFSLQQY